MTTKLLYSCFDSVLPGPYGRGSEHCLLLYGDCEPFELVCTAGASMGLMLHSRCCALLD